MVSLEIITIILAIFVLIKLFFTVKNQFYCLTPVILVFDFVFVVPIALEIFKGIPKIPYPNLKYAMKDQQTLAIYLLFLLFAEIIFLYEIHHLKNRIKRSRRQGLRLNDVGDLIANFKYKNIVIVGCYFVFAYIIIKILMAPDPLYYTRINAVNTTLSGQMLSYREDMRSLINLLVVAVILLKFFDKKNKISGLITRIIFIITIVFVDQKRTLLMLLVGACFLIDYLRNKQGWKFVLKYAIIIGFTAFYFYYYTIITDKISYNSDWYYELNEYIFRSLHLRFAIYAYLHPQEIHILDYPGQSILFSLFFWVPRSFWASKPWPYVYYFISGALGYSSLSYDKIGWGMPPSLFPEFVSNFGLIGLPLSVFFVVWLARFFDRRNFLCKLLGVSLIAILEIYYYDDMLKALALVVLLLCIKEKMIIKNGHLVFIVKKNRAR